MFVKDQQKLLERFHVGYLATRSLSVVNQSSAHFVQLPLQEFQAVNVPQQPQKFLEKSLAAQHVHLLVFVAKTSVLVVYKAQLKIQNVRAHRH